METPNKFVAAVARKSQTGRAAPDSAAENIVKLFRPFMTEDLPEKERCRLADLISRMNEDQ